MWVGVEVKHAGIAQLGERQTEDLKVAGSIPAVGTYFFALGRFFFVMSVVRGVSEAHAIWAAHQPWQLGRVVKAID